MNTLIREIYEWIYSIVIALAIAMVIHIFVVQPTRVSGESMVPTLHNGEYLVVEKWDHILGREPDYGDIVIIDSRVLYDRTWTIWPFLIKTCRPAMYGLKESSVAAAIHSPFTTVKFGATVNRSTNRI